jgi:hypothetical protein
MANSPLFRTHRGGENQVPSPMPVVFQRLELSLPERPLRAVAQECALQLVAFVKQLAGAGASVPDARTSARFDYGFGTTTVPNALGVKQLSEHYKNLTGGARHEPTVRRYPGCRKSAALSSLEDDRVIWFNFRAMSDAIDEILDDNTTFVGEQTRFPVARTTAALLKRWPARHCRHRGWLRGGPWSLGA